jgi:carbonic anhydrase
VTLTPAEAWSALRDGNDRFVRGAMEHPSQGIDHRASLSREQHPFAVIFGCSDSRVAAEIIFDQGLGDVFVVRTAGHVLDTTVIGSIEYGVELLGASLVVVLGHDSCRDGADHR